MSSSVKTDQHPEVAEKVTAENEGKDEKPLVQEENTSEISEDLVEAEPVAKCKLYYIYVINNNNYVENNVNHISLGQY